MDTRLLDRDVRAPVRMHNNNIYILSYDDCQVDRVVCSHTLREGGQDGYENTANLLL